MKFGIWGNTDKEKFWSLLDPILSWSEKNSLDPYITTRIYDKLPPNFSFSPKVIKSADEFNKLDFLIALGGDGTILSAARAVGARKTPIAGIHLGELGFLAEITLDEMFKRLNQIIEKSFSVNSKMVLKATLSKRNSEKIFFALNDFVVDRGQSQRIIDLELYAGKSFISSYKSDGLIISTPTGSTAYSLSAGGPILAPEVSAITVTPLSPHTLSLRPIVLSDNQILKIISPSEGNIAFAVDGQVSDYFSNDTEVKIEKASYDIRMISFSDSDYFKTLNLKMGWGRRGKD
jgi:NAD+ kinase